MFWLRPCRRGVSPSVRRASCFRVTGSNLIATSAFGSVHGLLHSTAFDVARNLVLVLALVFWLGLAYWVYRDARRRVEDPWLVGTATLLAVAAPYVGAVVYLLFRAPETLDDAHARALEVRALESRIEMHTPQCPVCRAHVEASFLVCPVCTTQLKQPCRSCSAALDAAWQACPYCATPVIARADLDAALTAEAASANGKVNRNGKAPARAKRARAKT
jgi:Zn-finger nucleic acid-binding protein